MSGATEALWLGINKALRTLAERGEWETIRGLLKRCPTRDDARGYLRALALDGFHAPDEDFLPEDDGPVIRPRPSILPPPEALETESPEGFQTPDHAPPEVALDDAPPEEPYRESTVPVVYELEPGEPR